MAFQLPELPFERDALAPHISAETMDFHHGRHHAAYVKKTNGLIAGTDLEGASLVEVIRAAKERGDGKLFDNAAQVWNHSFFWQCLAPQGSTSPSGRLKERIDADFGSTEALLEKLETESGEHFASGWGWLVLDNGKLEVISLHDADTPVAHGMTPLLTVDVWEHAYYIDYRNERPRYLKSVLSNILNWDFVAANLDGRGAGRADQEGAQVRETETAE